MIFIFVGGFLSAVRYRYWLVFLHKLLQLITSNWYWHLTTKFDIKLIDIAQIGKKKNFRSYFKHGRQICHLLSQTCFTFLPSFNRLWEANKQYWVKLTIGDCTLSALASNAQEAKKAAIVPYERKVWFLSILFPPYFHRINITVQTHFLPLPPVYITQATQKPVSASQ